MSRRWVRLLIELVVVLVAAIGGARMLAWLFGSDEWPLPAALTLGVTWGLVVLVTVSLPMRRWAVRPPRETRTERNEDQL